MEEEEVQEERFSSSVPEVFHEEMYLPATVETAAARSGLSDEVTLTAVSEVMASVKCPAEVSANTTVLPAVPEESFILTVIAI